MDFYMLSITFLEDKMTRVSIDYQDVLCFKLWELFLSKVHFSNYKRLGC